MKKVKIKNRKPSRNTLNAMYMAVAKYIEEAGGSAVVMGGVMVMKYPDDLKYNYTLCIKVTGKPPLKS